MSPHGKTNPTPPGPKHQPGYYLIGGESEYLSDSECNSGKMYRGVCAYKFASFFCKMECSIFSCHGCLIYKIMIVNGSGKGQPWSLAPKESKIVTPKFTITYDLDQLSPRKKNVFTNFHFVFLLFFFSKYMTVDVQNVHLVPQTDMNAPKFPCSATGLAHVVEKL